VGWRGRVDTVSAGQAYSKDIAEQSNSAYVRLGVKWSQVQILSARQEFLQYRGGFGEIRSRHFCVFGGLYANRYANQDFASHQDIAHSLLQSAVWPH
jgi:hypothetical protein